MSRTDAVLSITLILLVIGLVTYDAQIQAINIKRLPVAA